MNLHMNKQMAQLKIIIDNYKENANDNIQNRAVEEKYKIVEDSKESKKSPGEKNAGVSIQLGIL